jgi:hypothetical protein
MSCRSPRVVSNFGRFCSVSESCGAERLLRLRRYRTKTRPAKTERAMKAGAKGSMRQTNCPYSNLDRVRR